MAQIIAKRVVDRSKYPHAMMFVDKDGNVCVADRPEPLSDAEKQKRLEARKAKRTAEVAERKDDREALAKARAKAKKEPSVANAEAYEQALATYAKKWG